MGHYDDQRELDLYEELKSTPERRDQLTSQPERAGSLLLQLINLRNQIDLDGWIVIPPPLNSNTIELRIEWYIDREKHSWCTMYNTVEIEQANVDLIPLFIIRANNFIRVKTGKANKKEFKA